MNDITSYEDCVFLIQKFYDELLLDEQISHFFVDLDLEEHIPRVAQFWAFVLLDQTGYNSNMMAAHSQLTLKGEDFDRWLLLFHQTINKYFAGEKRVFWFYSKKSNQIQMLLSMGLSVK